MKINENKLRKVIRSILEGGEIGLNYKLDYNNMRDIKVNVYILTPAYNNSNFVFKTPELKKRFGNGREVVKHSFNEIMDLFLRGNEERNEKDNGFRDEFLFTYVGTEENPYVILFEDETFNAKGNINKSLLLKKRILNKVPDAFVYNLNKAGENKFKYTEEYSSNNASIYDIEKYPHLAEQLKKYEAMPELMLRKRTTFATKRETNLSIKDAVRKYIPKEDQKGVYEELVYLLDIYKYDPSIDYSQKEANADLNKRPVKKGLFESELPTFRGVSGTILRSHGDWSDPEIEADGYIANYWEVEEALMEDYREEYGEQNGDDEMFDRFCQDNEDLVLYYSKVCGNPIEQEQNLFEKKLTRIIKESFKKHLK